MEADLTAPWEPPAFQRGGSPTPGIPLLVAEWATEDGTQYHLLADYTPGRQLRVQQFVELSGRWVDLEIPAAFRAAVEAQADSSATPKHA